MNKIHLNEIDLATRQDVITSGDYETCPTIKSSDGINTTIVVKFDEMLHSMEARRDHGDNNHYKSSENRPVEGAHQ